MAFCVGKDCKVAVGTDKVLGIGTFSISGIQADQLETTSFDDEWKTFEFGLKDGGTFSFDGLLDPADSTGQNALITAADANTSMTTLRFYINNTSYWTPATTNPLSCVYITSYSISADKSGMAQVSFQGKISGKLALA